MLTVSMHEGYAWSPAHTGDSPNSATVAVFGDCRRKGRL